jgi:hypothetical protein
VPVSLIRTGPINICEEENKTGNQIILITGFQLIQPRALIISKDQVFFAC